MGAPPVKKVPWPPPPAPPAPPLAQAASTAAQALPALPIPSAADKTVHRSTGRRKTSVARVSLRRGNGAFVVNRKPADDYFKGEADRYAIRAALRATKTLGFFDVSVNVRGGGVSGQAGAVLLGVARALKRAIPGADALLRAEGMLTRDPREKERRKYGRRKARRGFQWTKR